MAFGLIKELGAAPTLAVWKALELIDHPEHENMATHAQAMDVWSNAQGVESGPEILVAQTHQYWNFDKRSDDQQWVVAWESNGTHLTELTRMEMSCPDVSATVPNRGPYIYEARLQDDGRSLHPECGCVAGPGRPCPRGVEATTSSGSTWGVDSPLTSHFVILENEWEERIADSATVARVAQLVKASVKVVSAPIRNLTEVPAMDAGYACPGTRDDQIGNAEVTKETLRSLDRVLPDGHVTGAWCLVKRGFCSETAKAKVCELSGAIGIIVVDHGNEPAKDQDITIRFSRAAGERATIPIIFVSLADGTKLINDAAANNVEVAIGPSIGGRPPPNFHPGSGITVHALLAPDEDTPANISKSYPNLFSTMAWLEVSAIRDVLFVCLPEFDQIRMYDVSQPLISVLQLGAIDRQCTKRGMHDYRVLEFKGKDQRFKTLLVDPFDNGNRLYYYDTHDPSSPRLELELHARWEADYSGLGQVKVGGVGGRYHIVTWQCSDVYCGKNHGDALYILDTHDLTAPAVKVPLPMLSKGSFVRDVGCDAAGICVVSLTWDGLVVLDSGAAGSMNKHRVVAQHIGKDPFSGDMISQVTLRFFSGAQKVYPSKKFPNKFYVEHADLEMKPLRVGDAVRALQMTKVYIAHLQGYDPSVLVAPIGNRSSLVGVSWIRASSSDLSSADNNPELARTDKLPVPLIVGAAVGCLTVMVAVLSFLVVSFWRKNQAQKIELELNQARLASGAGAGDGANVVVGRPVDPAHAASGATTGEPLAGAPGASPAKGAAGPEGKTVVEDV